MARKTVELSLGQVMQLNSELKQMNKEKDISFVTKYKLIKLYEKTSKLVKNLDNTRIQIFKEYGTEVEDSPGNYTLENVKADVKAKAVKELELLVAVIEKFNGIEFKLDDFKDLKTEVSYEVIFSFMVE
jgi:thiamine pyrophosphokinase